MQARPTPTLCLVQYVCVTHLALTLFNHIARTKRIGFLMRLRPLDTSTSWRGYNCLIANKCMCFYSFKYYVIQKKLVLK